MKNVYRRLMYATPAIVLAFIIFFFFSGQTTNTGTSTYTYPGRSDVQIKTTSARVGGKLFTTRRASENSLLHELNNELTDVASKINPAVVTITTTQKVQVRNSIDFGPFRFFNGPEQQTLQAMGSGVIISSDGYILTNNHVIKKANSIVVRLSNGKDLPARVIGADPATDIAVIRVNTKNLPVASIGNSDDVKVGQIVLAVGSPLSESLANTVTSGIVSAKERTTLTDLSSYSNYIQTDAAINPGNSGGALIDVDGNLIGINSAIATETGGYQGIGFAIPINMARNVMEQLINNGKVVRGYLGVIIGPVSPALAKAFNLNRDNGALVQQVKPGSPANKAGLKAGDVVIALNGRAITNPNELRNDIAATGPGTTVTLTVIRDGNKKDINVQIRELNKKE